MTIGSCPDRATLIGYVTGTIAEEEADRVARHLASCTDCEQTVEALEGLSDPMMSAQRQSGGGDPGAEDPKCQEARERLRALRIGRADSSSGGAHMPQPEKRRRAVKLGDYGLLKRLGQGGMGTVYLARHGRLKRVVALKVLPKDRLDNEEAVQRFEREMEAVGRLDHPNIARALDAREVDGVRFLVMEYIEGLDLSEIVKRCGPLSIADACDVIQQAAQALACSHENGLVHRDVKPSNLMLNSSGQVKLLDLGLAQCQEAESLAGEITGVGQVMGTPDYVSPEQAMESHAVDIRTDLYSLGATFYHLLAGHGPFSGPAYDSPMKKVTGHVRDPVPPIQAARSDLPKPVALLLKRMLAKEPDKRPQGPTEVANMLAPFSQGSTLITVLREAGRQKATQSPMETSRLETNEFQTPEMVETSRTPSPPGAEHVEPPAVAASFDPYHRWLGIPPSEQPAHHYRLLGLAAFEDDVEVIRDAATRQMAHVRSYHLGQHADLSQQILNELAAAKACLLNPEKNAAYDASLRQRLGPVPAHGWGAESANSDTGAGPRRFQRIEANRLGSPSERSRRARSFPWLSRRSLEWTAVALILAIASLGIVLVVRTRHGTVRIALSDPSADVQVKVDGDVIELSGPHDPLRLEPGEHELVVTGPDYQAVGHSFSVKRGEETVLDVELCQVDTGKCVVIPEKRAIPAWNTILPSGAPLPAIAPFDASTAKKHQRAWANYLQVPLHEEHDLEEGVRIRLVLIPPGEFVLGAPPSEKQAVRDLRSQHRVRITKPFYLGVTEVTQGQWESIMDSRPWQRADPVAEGAEYPAAYVSWEEAMEFCQTLSSKMGLTYRLATEAEWEYACRAGTNTRFYFGDDVSQLGDYAWFKENARDLSASYGHRVGQKNPNAFGLYDMHGNVWEWCADWHSWKYFRESPLYVDPGGPETGSHRVHRGGSWWSPAERCQASIISGGLPTTRFLSLGLRLARGPVARLGD